MGYDPSKPLVFVHIPRTGGSGLRDVFARQWFRGQYQAGGIADHGATAHHYSTFAEPVRIPPDAQLVTFLRDPLERLAAWYSFVKHTHGGNLIWDGPFTLRTDKDFSVFIRDVPPYWHQSSFLVPGRPLSSYLFVGDFVHVRSGVDVLARLLGKHKVMLPGHIAARNSPKEDLSIYTRGMGKEFARLYPEEVALYREARALACDAEDKANS